MCQNISLRNIEFSKSEWVQWTPVGFSFFAKWWNDLSYSIAANCAKLLMETTRKIKQTFDNNSMSIRQSDQRWPPLVESRPRSARSPTSRSDKVIDVVQTLVMRNRCVTTRELTDLMEINMAQCTSWLSAFHFDKLFGHAESVGEIRAEAIMTRHHSSLCFCYRLSSLGLQASY